MTERQTLSYLQSRFESVGIQPQTKFGQNFLVDLNLVELIAKTADLGPRDVVLEVGTGLGSLTNLLAASAGHVITVEIDQHLIPLAKSEFADHENVTLLEQDALKSKNQLHPDVISTIQEKVAGISGGRLKLVANLPYNVATPIISNLLDLDPWPVRMVTTIQKELALRITAEPKTKDYSALSIWIQSQCKCELVRVMPPGVFWPRPKVESAILDIQPQKLMRKRLKSPEQFHQLVRNIFTHRRKFLRSALLSAIAPKQEKQVIDEILEEFGADGQVRAETLSPSRFIELADIVAKRVPQPPA